MRSGDSAKSPLTLVAGESIQIQVTPKAPANRIQSAAFPDGTRGFRVWVTAAPAKGKANQAMMRLLAQELGVPKSELCIIRGETSRKKVVQVRPRS